MGKGFTAKGFRSGLFALTTLATIATASAQDHGGRDRGGMERQGNGGGFGGGQRPDGRQGGDPRGGQGAWNGNSGAQPQQSPRVDAPTMGARPADRQGNGQALAPWQARPGQAPANPQVSTTPFRGNPDRGGNWQGGNGYRGNNPDGVGWQNRAPGGYAAPRPGANRGNGNSFRQGDNGLRTDDRRPPAGYGSQYQGGFQNRGHLNNDDRWRDQQRWSNNWRRDSRYDWSRYRQANGYAYHLPAYRAPSGWGYGYSRFSIGIFLGGPLYSDSYWIDDPYSYRLPPAYGTLRWIRYYDDALLVDIRDGYVADVIHDFFW